MTTSTLVTAAMFGLLAAAHSIAGETGFIRPIVNAEWTIAEVPRWAANRLLRTAWHLTSVAWLALGVITIGGTPLTAVSVAALVSSLMMFVGLRGHPAWPLFLIAGVFGLRSAGALPDTALRVGVVATIIALLAAAGLHVYWASGGRRLMHAAVPTKPDETRTFTPGPLATLAVAVALVGFAGLLAWSVAAQEPWFVRWAVLAGVAVLGMRALGDGNYAGFTKKHRDTVFGAADDRFFTPLVVFLAIGASGAVLV